MGLLSFIKNPLARKIFGKQELKIIERQLLGIALTPSEKTRLSRDIRKKLEAVKELAKYSSEFKLKKGAEINFIISQVKEVILESKYFSKIKKIIIFGSTVEDTRTFRSDIDIGVEFDDIDKKDAAKFRVYVSSRVSDKVDVQVLNVLPEKVKRSIDKNHRIIYKNELGK